MWRTECIEILRGLIFDLSETPDFTDSELLRLLIIAAHYVNKDADFLYSYVVDISEQSIDPDPSTDDTKDPDFLNFVCLKAACMLDIGQSRIKAASAVLTVKDDKNTVQFNDVAKNFLALAGQGHCKVYEQSLMDYRINGTAEYAQAILSPFRTVLGGYRRINFYQS